MVSCTAAASVSVTIVPLTATAETVAPTIANAEASGTAVVSSITSNVSIIVLPSTVTDWRVGGVTFAAASGPNDTVSSPDKSSSPLVDGFAYETRTV